jgi:hypothetical protein
LQARIIAALKTNIDASMLMREWPELEYRIVTRGAHIEQL